MRSLAGPRTLDQLWRPSFPSLLTTAFPWLHPASMDTVASLCSTVTLAELSGDRRNS